MNSEKTIDCQGLPCPQPVLRCKELVEKEHPQKISVLVDNDPALENVSRFLSHQGYQLNKPEKQEDFWVISALRGQESGRESISDPQDRDLPRTLIMITSDRIGKGDDELGAKLMLNFLATLPEMGEGLWKIVLVNSGVRLAVEGSLVLGSLVKLENSGASVLVCGTCIEFFGLKDRKKTGQTTNMLDIVSAMSMADKIVTL